MNYMYKLQRWFPHPQMGGAGFNIILNKKWKEAVSQSSITQDGINNMIDNLGNFILLGHGRDAMEECMIKCRIRVKWGEWGPEHITVPGNACGLDIDKSWIGLGSEEVALTPHNVDSVNQASMLLTVFIKIAEILEGEVWQRERNMTKPFKSGIEFISEERQRQINVEGWTPEHDEMHKNGELAHASACYAAMPYNIYCHKKTDNAHYFEELWPFDKEWYKPSPDDRIKELAKAGALIAAEIDRLQRMNQK